MDLTGTSVLVTGAGGFIGSHLVQQLLQEGAHVRAFVHYNSLNRRGFIDDLSESEQRQVEVIKGDLRDPDTVSRAMKGNDCVFHLGAHIGIPYSYASPTDVYQTNVFGTLHVAQAALREGVSCFVHTSTSETYGSALYVPMDENHPLQAQSPYSASKIAADKLVESFWRSYGLPVKIVRPFNAYGPRQSMRAVIPTIINQALYQAEIQLGNLTATRDFTFVEDTAHAFVCAAKSAQGCGEVVNAGSGFEISIGALAEHIRGLIGRDIPIHTVDERKRVASSEVHRLWSNSQKAQQVFGWVPKVTLLQGLQRTVEWMQANRAYYRPAEYVL